MTGARWLSVVGLSIVLAVILTLPTATAPLGAVTSAEEADAVAVAERLTAELLSLSAVGASAGTSSGADSLVDKAREANVVATAERQRRALQRRRHLLSNGRLRSPGCRARLARANARRGNPVTVRREVEPLSRHDGRGPDGRRLLPG